MSNVSDIERVVMRRVHVIRLFRPLLSAGAFAILVFALALWGIGREVWVAHVFQNATHVHGALPFWLAAFEHTRLSVQALILASLASLVYLAQATARTLTSLLSPLARA